MSAVTRKMADSTQAKAIITAPGCYLASRSGFYEPFRRLQKVLPMLKIDATVSRNVSMGADAWRLTC